MKTSIKNFASNFQSLNTKQLNKVVGGNSYAVGRRRNRFGGSPG